MSAYAFERYQGPLEPLAALLLPEIDNAAATRELEWKYTRAPHGPGDIWVIRSGEELAAMIAMYRRNVLVDGELLVGCQNADLVVHPAHRRKGLAVRILKECFEDAPSRGYQLSYGFPNQISLPAQRQAGGWTELGTFQTAVSRPGRLHSLARRAASRLPGVLRNVAGTLADRTLGRRESPPERFRGIPIDETPTSLEEYEPFWRAVAAQGGFRGVRDYGWHRWRFLEKPNYACRLLYARSDGALRGYVALTMKQTESGLTVASVVDLLAIDAGTSSALLEASCAHARSAHAVEISFARIGAAWDTVPFGDRSEDSHQIVFVRSLPAGAVELPDNPQWTLCLGDSDVT